MALAAGTRFGPYEVLSALGAGGMGEVYRARDSRLNRDVALKIISDGLAADAEHLARFRREAQVLASLNHPNIAAIYGIEESGSVRGLVMELVEGPTLADRIARGAMPPDEALPLAMQIAEALEAAHERGVVHRDLKPANVKITPAGSVKVLDFGLAAVIDEPARVDVNASRSPTISLGATKAGLILGTAAYMSPEQAAARPLDKRTDIWSFGVVVWEMLTGRRLFDGETLSHTLADVLRAPIDVNQLPRTTPRVIRELLQRCLDRDPKRRLRDIGEARVQIERWMANPVEAPGPAPPGSTPRRPIAPWVAAAALLVALAALAVTHFGETPAPAPTMRFEIPPPDKASVVDYPTISPDGRRLAFVATVAGRTLLWIRPLDSLAAQPIPQTEDAAYPFWSPDSRFIGYFSSGKLKSVDLSTEVVQTICGTGTPRGAAWNAAGTILFASDLGAVWSVPAGGGKPTPVTVVDDATELMHAWPAFLPDNRHFLYWIHARGPDRGKDAVIIGSLDGTPDSKERRRLMLSSSQAAFSAGHVLFEREGALMARPFDDTRLEWRGDPFPVAAHVRRFVPRYGWGAFSVSSTGTLAYHTGIGWPSRTQLAWFDRGGTEVRRLGQPVDQFAPKISPDQQRVAVVQGDSQGKLDVWLIDVARDSRTRLTASTALSSLPIWSPDGTRILFNSNRGDSWDLYVKPSNGVGSEELLLKSNVAKLGTDWSPNGVVIYQQRQPNRGYDIWAVPVDGDRKPWPVVQSEFNDINGQISPNGKWLAYESDESLHSEIYVQGFPQSSGKLRVSTGGGTRPRWNHNGRELFYLSPDRKMMSVDVQSDGPTFVIGRTRELFQTRAADAPFVASVYDVTKDGKLFLISTAAEADTPPPTTIVINFAQKR